jgi:glycosyltransferase involved in cell wall biosynthesis
LLKEAVGIGKEFVVSISTNNIKTDTQTAVTRDRQLVVLWLVDHLGHDGNLHGAARYYLNVIPRFDSKQIIATLCVLRQKDILTEMFEQESISVYHLSRSKFDPRALLDVVRLVRSKSIDLIHAHGYGSTNIARVAGVVCRIPVIIHAHDVDRNYPWFQQAADMLLSPFTSRAIAVSQSVREACVSKRRVAGSKVSVLHNGIPLDRFSEPAMAAVAGERERLGIPSNASVVGTVGRLREEKGTRFLIEAAPAVLERFPNTIFLVVGDGPLRTELEDLAGQLGVAENILFTGFREDIQIMLGMMDVVVVPSLSEGFGLVVVEAMAIKKPVIASRVGGINEIITDDQNGLLIPAGDPGAVAAEVIGLLESVDRRKSLAAAAFQSVQAYSIEAHVQRLQEIYWQTV